MQLLLKYKEIIIYISCNCWIESGNTVVKGEGWSVDWGGYNLYLQFKCLLASSVISKHVVECVRLCASENNLASYLIHHFIFLLGLYFFLRKQGTKNTNVVIVI